MIKLKKILNEINIKPKERGYKVTDIYREYMTGIPDHTEQYTKLEQDLGSDIAGAIAIFNDLLYDNLLHINVQMITDEHIEIYALAAAENAGYGEDEFPDYIKDVKSLLIDVGILKAKN